MLRFSFNGASIELEDRDATLRLLEHDIETRNRAEAEQKALAVVYRVGGEPDATRPYCGLLTERLDISYRTASDLITEGRIAYTCCGKKGYRVTERAVREFLGDLEKTA